MAIKLLVALQADDTILLQISEGFVGDGDKTLAHVKLDRPQAIDIAKQITRLAELIPDKAKRS